MSGETCFGGFPMSSFPPRSLAEMRKLASCRPLGEAKRGDVPTAMGSSGGSGGGWPQGARRGGVCGPQLGGYGRARGFEEAFWLVAQPLVWETRSEAPSPGGRGMEADRGLRSQAEPRGLGEGLCVCASQEPLPCCPLPAMSQTSSTLDIRGPLSEAAPFGVACPSQPLLPACGPGRDVPPAPAADHGSWRALSQAPWGSRTCTPT